MLGLSATASAPIVGSPIPIVGVAPLVPATKLAETPFFAQHYYQIATTPTLLLTSQVIKASVIAKAGERNLISFQGYDGTTTQSVEFDLNAGTQGPTPPSAGITANSITSLGNGWYQLSITFPMTATG